MQDQQRIDKSPLVVDMDGTLVRSDTLHEALLAHFADRPQAVFRFLGLLAQGKARFKNALADECIIQGGELPLNQDVLEKIKQARQAGRKIILVSAADQRQAEAIADSVELFDEVYGTSEQTNSGKNLSGQSKAEFLVKLFGEGQFDYVGDSHVDLPVWQAANKTITVDASHKLRRAAEGVSENVEHLGRPRSKVSQFRHYLRALRPHQWVKNILIFLPMLAAHDFSKIGDALLAFVAFSMTASAIYLVNDVLDLSADRAHPRKCKRPFAACDIPVMHGPILFFGLFGFALLISLLFLPLIFSGVLLIYVATTVAYSLVLKRKLIVDVWTLAALYTIRLVAGAAATGISLSPWLLGFSMFLFFGLAAIKRQAELTDQIRRNVPDTAGRAYRTSDLPVLQMMALSAGYTAVLLFALYTNSAVVSETYAMPSLLWSVCPVLLYWITRIAIMTHRGYMTDDPIIFSAKDWQSQICGLLMAGLFVGASVLNW
ncbi:Decaprenyl-phosphate phosphoribosyltransferase [Roseovarius litorisediminis]|uniref:Decaprenyl-phosphate phosphoribosyltransferase n=1 Tax=Roseovarius litorisediminis TaxID=1312363 RepID=A0A1Y5TNA0_9RHOB|nr:UbiA family prenyltransferase [Roseovarius litorisediminis]SLN68065.1 Decaprenyl-phosphate phosphoribosyltransferase [Roseovarius litorisediminis]